MKKSDRRLVNAVQSFYRAHGRHSLPWRKTTKPYNIVVSELMLQQTQVERVLPKYQAFIRRWPTTKALAEASLKEVLQEWQGLGYNRRAKLLHQCAKMVRETRAGKWPQTYEGLLLLPGIGPYTAGAVMAFAYNQAVPLIETNIRTVYLHHYFADKENVADADLLPFITRTLDYDNPRTWYSALMDYGSYIKSTYPNPNRFSKHHVKQATFKGSDRQIRGAIIRTLSLADRALTLNNLTQALPEYQMGRVQEQLQKLCTEEMVQQTNQRYVLPH